MRFLMLHDGPAVTLQWPAATGAGLSSRMLDVGGFPWHLRGQAAAAGRPLLALHDLGSSVRAFDERLAGLLGSRPLLAPDLPGHGLSDDTASTTPDETALALSSLLDAVDIDDADVLAEGATAAAALALAARCPGVRVRLWNPRAVAQAEMPSVAALASTLLHRYLISPFTRSSSSGSRYRT